MERPLEIGVSENNLLLWTHSPHQQVQFRIQFVPYRTTFTQEPQCHLWANIKIVFTVLYPFAFRPQLPLSFAISQISPKKKNHIIVSGTFCTKE